MTQKTCGNCKTSRSLRRPLCRPWLPAAQRDDAPGNELGGTARPSVGDILHITQQELAYLVGLSRQRVNEALSALQDQGTTRVEYGELRVLDLPALRTTVFGYKK